MLEQVFVQPTSNGSYVTPFQNRVSIFESSCLLRDDFNLAMKNASKFLGVLPSSGAPSKILHKKEFIPQSYTKICISERTV